MGLFAIGKHSARPRELGQSSSPLTDFGKKKTVAPAGEPILNFKIGENQFLNKKEAPAAGPAALTGGEERGG